MEAVYILVIIYAPSIKEDRNPVEIFPVFQNQINLKALSELSGKKEFQEISVIIDFLMLSSEQMCFSIPLKVLEVKNQQAIVEGDKKIVIGKDILVKKGEYLQVVGNMAVGRLTKIEGQRVRKLIKSLN